MKRYALALLILTAARLVIGEVRNAQVVLDEWNRRIRECASLLKTARYERALRIAERTIDEMIEVMGSGETGTKMLGIAVGQKAIAKAGLNQLEDASWYWSVARSIFPDLDRTDLSQFGKAGEAISAVQSCSEIPATPSPAQSITPPKLLKKETPKYPRGALELRERGTLELAVVLTKEGKVTCPRIVTPLPAATLSYSALEAVKLWQYEPARVEGVPIAISFHLTVNYKR